MVPPSADSRSSSSGSASKRMVSATGSTTERPNSSRSTTAKASSARIAKLFNMAGAKADSAGRRQRPNDPANDSRRDDERGGIDAPNQLPKPFAIDRDHRRIAHDRRAFSLRDSLGLAERRIIRRSFATKNPSRKTT